MGWHIYAHAQKVAKRNKVMLTKTWLPAKVQYVTGILQTFPW